MPCNHVNYSPTVITALSGNCINHWKCTNLTTFATIHGCLQPSATFCDHLRSFATICGRLRLFATACDHLQPFATFCDCFDYLRLLAIICTVWNLWNRLPPFVNMCDHLRQFAYDRLQPFATINCYRLRPLATACNRLWPVATIVPFTTICDHLRPFATIWADVKQMLYKCFVFAGYVMNVSVLTLSLRGSTLDVRN